MRLPPPDLFLSSACETWRHNVTSCYSSLRDLPLVIESSRLERLELAPPEGFRRLSTLVSLEGSLWEGGQGGGLRRQRALALVTGRTRAACPAAPHPGVIPAGAGIS